MSNKVHGLWIKGKLSAMELLTIESFMRHGFSFYLWTYEPACINAHDGCIVNDANIILAEYTVFSYRKTNAFGHGKGSYAGFSDIFRYKLLYEKGGIWTDMDITCLRNFEIRDDYFFRFHHKTGAVGNFIKCPVHSPIMKWCYEQAVQKVNADNTDWMLPINILNEGIQIFELQQYINQISNNDSFPEVLPLISSKKPIPDNWNIIHWMNEEFRRLNINKDTVLINSTIQDLYAKNNIRYDYYRGKDIIIQHIKLNRLAYLLHNIGPSIKWYYSVIQKIFR